MTKQQQEMRLMFLAVIDLFERSADVWNGVAPIVPVYNRFKDLVKDISDMSLIQQQNRTVGYTADKKAKREELIKSTFSLALKLKSFAKVTGNTILETAADYSVTDLEQLTETELLNTATTLAASAWQYSTTAAAYQVTPEVINGLSQNINNYTPLIIQRDSVGDKRKIATVNLKSLYADAVKQLKLVNDLLNALVDDKAFIDGFVQAKRMRSANKAKPEEQKPEV